MNKFVRLLVFTLLTSILVHDQASSFAATAQQPQKQPGPGKKFVVTPFGPIEVDMSDPRPGIAFGPPLEPAPPGQVTAQPPAQAAPTQVQGDPEVPVQLNIDNQEIPQVVRTLASVLGINYVIDPTVRGTVNIGMSGTVRRSELLGILEAILKMNGATMVRSGAFYQIVPASTAVRMPLEVQSARPAVAPDDQVVLQVVPMKFVVADEMARVLMPFLSEAGNIVAQGSVLLVTDRRSNLRKLLELIDTFDSRAFQGERVRMLPIKNTRVKEIIDDLKAVFSGYALSTNTSIRFLPIERMNAILVVSPDASVFADVERWLDRLDQPIQSAGLQNFIYRPKNSKAADLQRVLMDLYSDEAQAPIPVAAPAGAAAQAGVTTPPPPPPGGVLAPGQPLPTEPPPPAARLSGQMKIVVDTVNNQLVIQATSQDYQAIERTLQALDILPKQVLIDAQIYEVSLDHTMSLGLSAILQNRSQATHQTTASFTNATALSASTFAFIGRTRELLAFLNASENRSRVRTLSAPSILVSNNAPAEVQIGAEVPVPTTTSASGAQQVGGATLFAQTIQYRNTGVILNVTPQINEGGNLTLTIAQEVSQASANTTSNLNAPVIGKSGVRSTIVVQDGETIPLTGFIRESDLLGRNRVPLLGSIPVAGLLFGNTSKSNTRSELIVLITPHVVTTVDERAVAAEELKSRLREIKRLIN